MVIMHETSRSNYYNNIFEDFWERRRRTWFRNSGFLVLKLSSKPRLTSRLQNKYGVNTCVKYNKYTLVNVQNYF